MFGRFKVPWLIGKAAKILTRLHYRYEVKPYSEKMGHDRGEVREVCAIAVQRIFDEAWPVRTSNEEAR